MWKIPDKCRKSIYVAENRYLANSAAIEGLSAIYKAAASMPELVGGALPEEVGATGTPVREVPYSQPQSPYVAQSPAPELPYLPSPARPESVRARKQCSDAEGALRTPPSEGHSSIRYINRLSLLVLGNQGKCCFSKFS